MESSTDPKQEKTTEKQTVNKTQYFNLKGELLQSPPSKELGEVNKIAKEMDKLQKATQKSSLLTDEQEKRYKKLEKQLKNAIRDYQAAWENIGVAELWGLRMTQEDRVAFGDVPGFNDLSPDSRKNVLTNTVQTLASIISKHSFSKEAGSTLCSTVLVGNEIYTSNLGDSTAFIYILDKFDQPHLIPLNNKLHHPDDDEETKRIEAAGGKVTHDRGAARINGDLAISRSLGDTRLDSAGLSHIPDVYKYKIDVPEGSTVFIINACDGLTEGNKLKKDDIKKLIKKNSTLETYQIAKILAQAAKDAKSGDNISVMVMRVDPKAKTPRHMTIFDGHGGDKVSEMASEIYNLVLENQVLLEKFKEINPQGADFLARFMTASILSKSIDELKTGYAGFNLLLNNLISKDLTQEDLPNFKKNFNDLKTFMNNFVNNELEKLREKYCGDDLPAEKLNQIKDNMNTRNNRIFKNIENSKNPEELRKGLNEIMEAIRSDAYLEELFKAGQVVLNVRKRYDKNMPSSYKELEFGIYKATDERKASIKDVELQLLSSFDNYPSSSVNRLLSNMHDKLKEQENFTKTHQEKTSYFQLGMFSTKSILEGKLTEAKLGISKIRGTVPVLKDYQDKLEEKHRREKH